MTRRLRIYSTPTKYTRFMLFCVPHLSNPWNHLITMLLLKSEITFTYYFLVGTYYGKVLSQRSKINNRYITSWNIREDLL